MDKSKLLTGQMITRLSGDSKDGRKLFMFVGVMAVPEGVKIETEHQYTFFINPGKADFWNELYGFAAIDPKNLEITLSLDPKHVTDVSDKTKGMGLDGMIHEPLWRY